MIKEGERGVYEREKESERVDRKGVRTRVHKMSFHEFDSRPCFSVSEFSESVNFRP